MLPVPASARWFRLGGAALVGVLLATGLWASVRAFRSPLGIYDEGILLTTAQLVLSGKVPFRDFYSNYPPGVFLLLAMTFRLLGPSVLVERSVGLLLHLLLAVAAGRVAGRLQGRPFGWLAASLVLLWLARLGAPPFAWLAALAVAFLFCSRWLAATGQAGDRRFLEAGLALGGVSWFRHDLCVYLALALGAVLLADAVLSRRLGRDGAVTGRSAGVLALGALASALVFWAPWFALAGPGRILGDLVLEQMRHVQPARVLPIPPLLALTRPAGIPLPLPALLADSFPAAVVLALVGPLLALLAALRPGMAGLPGPRPLSGVAALSFAVLPQLLGRTDWTHALHAVPPALVLGSLWATAEGRAARRAAVALLLACPPLLGAGQLRVPPLPEAFPELARARGIPDEEGPARRAVLDFIATYTAPGEPIYVGVVDHRWTVLNEMDLYFLADRPGGTRTMQFDPGLTNRADVQARMATELERSNTRVAILSSRHVRSFEPNASRLPGSTELDAYLRAHFSMAEVRGPYVVLLRSR